jgi:tetratricopeptide (TPR) repeat protein
MTYPGNPSLAKETKDRIVSTYNQTLDLAGQGRGQEAALGCDFILKMDPLFSPARQLQTRLQGASGPVDVSDLQPLVQEAAAPAPAAVAAPVVAPVAVATIEAPVSPEVVPLEAIVPPPVASAVLPPVAEERIEFPPPEAQMVVAPPVAAVVSEPVPPPEGNDRILELLADGQEFFERGDFQAAIDAWSRIFLIDIDHQEAAERIELARKLKDEQERKLDELLSGASELRDAGDTVGARDAYETILQMQPNHPAAVDALQRLDAAGREDGHGSEMAESLPEMGGDFDLPEADLYDPEADPSPSPSAKASSTGSLASFGGTVQKKKSKTLPMIAAVAAIVLAAGSFYLWSNKDSLFPNSDPPVIEAAAPQLPQADPIQKATGLFDQGETEMAIARLEEIEEGNAYYERAQQQLAVWRDQLAGDQEAPDVAEIDSDVAERRSQILESARQFYSSREYLAAAKAFRAADKLAALDGAARDLYDDSRRQLLPIRQQIDFFNQREWERLLPDLWQLHLKDPENRDIKRMLADSYYNLGVRALQRGAVEEAHDNIKEAAALYTDDLLAQRVLEFCAGYLTEPRDLLFKIFVDQLELRR